MKIAIIGNGRIGGGLARAWEKHGHQLAIADRDAASISGAVSRSDLVVLAVPHAALRDVIAAVPDWRDKIVVDCTNAVERGQLVYGHTTSAAEELAKQLPGAHVLKSFNAQGAENLANPVYAGVAADNFYCGDDADAKKQLRTLIEQIGFEAIDAGPLASARLLEPLMLLWIRSSQALGTRDVAFKILRR
jgi:8-hydroxy-5-deazaflavin:NADPH oxidoreductase